MNSEIPKTPVSDNPTFNLYTPRKRVWESVGDVSTPFQVLPSLPPYGPMPTQFSVDGRGTHREGFVVQFKDATVDWVGNFQPGGTGFNAAIRHPDGKTVIVIAGGQGYIVGPSTRSVMMTFGGDITGVILARPEQVVLSTFTDFRAFDVGGHQWRTRRLSWDGFRSLRVEGDELRGEAWTPIGDRWTEFSVQLATGDATGGAYP